MTYWLLPRSLANWRWWRAPLCLAALVFAIVLAAVCTMMTYAFFSPVLAAAYENSVIILATFFQLAVIFPLGLVCGRYALGLSWRELISAKAKVDWRFFWQVLAGSFVLLLVFHGVYQFAWLGFDFELESHWYILLIGTIVLLPLQSAAEELVFRGLLLQSLCAWFTARGAWVLVFAILSSLGFAMVHGAQNPALWFNRFATGLLLCAVVWRTQGLEGAIGLHIANNASMMLVTLLSANVYESLFVTEVGWPESLAQLIIMVGLCVWVVRRHQSLLLTHCD